MSTQGCEYRSSSFCLERSVFSVRDDIVREQPCVVSLNYQAGLKDFSPLETGIILTIGTHWLQLLTFAGNKFVRQCGELQLLFVNCMNPDSFLDHGSCCLGYCKKWSYHDILVVCDISCSALQDRLLMISSFHIYINLSSLPNCELFFSIFQFCAV